MLRAARDMLLDGEHDGPSLELIWMTWLTSANVVCIVGQCGVSKWMIKSLRERRQNAYRDSRNNPLQGQERRDFFESETHAKCPVSIRLPLRARTLICRRTQRLLRREA